ncbi:MAG: hypothetical protein GY937_13300 [bacterium]|nr:hypothetical protein [bacterium]
MHSTIKGQAALYQAVFNTPQGKKVWEDLTRELNPDEIFVKGDADETNVNIGKRAAFIYIDQLLRIETND